MFFLIGFAWHVAASFAFLLAILSPNWLTIQTTQQSNNINIQRGVFYVCDVISVDATSQTTTCTSIIALNSSMSSPYRWSYNFAISSSAIAIGCAGLSVIILWLAGIYFNVKRKTKCSSCLLISLSILLLLTFAASIAVWILLIAETLVLSYKVDRSIFNWPMWLAVGASGGYLMAFITMLISFCGTVCQSRQRRSHLYAANQY